MSAQDKVIATPKKVEGKVSAAVGEPSDNPEIQAKGKVGQTVDQPLRKGLTIRPPIKNFSVFVRKYLM